MTDSPTLETKVVILGHTGVGKTSMLHQFVRGSFTGQSTATIGAAFLKKIMLIDGWSVILQIWDTAGQERFRSMAPMYYRGAHAAVLVWDLTSADTLDKVGGWADELTAHSPEDQDPMVLVLAANKADLKHELEEATNQSTTTNQSTNQSIQSLQASAQQYANSIHAAYFETSAKTGEGIDELFHHVASTLLQNHLDKLARQPTNQSIDQLDESSQRSGRRKGKVSVRDDDGQPASRTGCC